MPANNNPSGKNQYKNRPPPDDPHVAALLRDYHRRGLGSRKLIPDLLQREHGITLGEASVATRLKKLGLTGSGATTKKLPSDVKRQLILDQMAQDPAGRQGPSTVKEAIARNTGLHLTREYCRTEMRALDSEAYEAREPTSKKIPRGVIVSLGPHHEWSCDGHDKLSAIGFPIWGVRDVWSRMWLGLWVVPNNRLLKSIAYLYLSLIVELGGMPLQSTTDCGSETTLMYGLANALREQFSPELVEVNIGPAHRFMKSVHNITIERGWNQVHNKWGVNIKMFWENGVDLYDPSIPAQYDLVQWLWPKLIQEELDHFRQVNNDHKPKKMAAKKLPSGVSPHVAFTLPEKYGGEDCLQRLDITVVQGLMEELGGEELVQFIPPEYAARAEVVFNSLEVEKLTTLNVWNVFTTMLPHM